jgi:hypothetical protein
MDIFSKNKFLVRVIFILIFLNLLSTGYLWFNMNKRPNRDQPKQEKGSTTNLLKDKLRLTEQQVKEINRIRDDFTQKEEQLILLIRAQRDSMNVAMFNQNTDALYLKRIARQLVENQYLMELYRIEQAQQFKNVCTKEQLTEFQNIVIDIRDFFQPPRKKE